MLIIALIVLSGYLLGPIEARPPNRRTDDCFEIFAEYVMRKCIKNSGHAAYIEHRVNVNALMSTYQSKKEEKGDQDRYNVLCEYADVYQFVSSSITLLEPCLDTEEKYLRNFILTPFNNSREVVCKDGKNGFNAILKNVHAQCDEILMEKMAISKICFGELLNTFCNDIPISFTKDILCGSLEKAKDCIVDGIKRVCTNGFFSDLMARVFQPHLDWCEQY